MVGDEEDNNIVHHDYGDIYLIAPVYVSLLIDFLNTPNFANSLLALLPGELWKHVHLLFLSVPAPRKYSARFYHLRIFFLPFGLNIHL